MGIKLPVEMDGAEPVRNTHTQKKLYSLQAFLLLQCSKKTWTTGLGAYLDKKFDHKNKKFKSFLMKKNNCR